MTSPMAPSRIADAAYTSPNQALSGAHSPHQMLPSTSANSTPQSSPKKSKGRPRANLPKAEENIKYNFGLPRSMLARKLIRRARPELLIDPYLMDVPDYPPPSFQEAISSTPISLCPSLASVPVVNVNDRLPPPNVLNHAVSNPELRDHPISDAHFRGSDSRSDSGSDSSHDYVDVPVERDNQLTVAVLHEQVKHVEQDQHVADLPVSRGRVKDRCQGMRDYEPEIEEERPAHPRRHTSLSSLRTLFPSLSLPFHDRAASAHPTTDTNSSPYPLSRNLPLFRSTTSLGLHGSTTSLTTKPSGTSLPSPVSGKFSLFHKGKDRSDVESWVVVDATDYSGFNPSESDPQSNTSPDMPNPEPFRGQAEIAHLETRIPTTQSHHSSPSKDRKVTPLPIAETAPYRVPGSPSQSIYPTEASRVSPTSRVPSIGSPLTTGRHGKLANGHTLTSKRSQVLNASPLATQAWKADEVATPLNEDPHPRPLDPPLVPVPANTFHSYTKTSPHLEAITADLAGLIISSASSREEHIHDSNSTDLWDPVTRRHYHGRPLPPPPGPPGIRAPVDSVYLTTDYRRDTDTGIKNTASCPEGLLIDLDDNTFSSTLDSGAFLTPGSGSGAEGRSGSPASSRPCNSFPFTEYSASTPNLITPVVFYPASSTIRGKTCEATMPGVFSCSMEHDSLPTRINQNGQPSPEYEVRHCRLHTYCWEREYSPTKSIKTSMPPQALTLARAQTHPSTSALSRSGTVKR
ncbi:hypothetical protein AMATHDRAFT_49837 [Amanita thiersii Skay4041]|uniref:Uncharacterized protein n=1 Tax=Amanita thiersii Skay4041 TaxID=703135 RepID=A0A2A9NK20_9AGAR|nr:hypothetical protein AMATHDRAFT_49837 [Amanita thiersii Skay4041]